MVFFFYSFQLRCWIIVPILSLYKNLIDPIIFKNWTHSFNGYPRQMARRTPLACYLRPHVSKDRFSFDTRRPKWTLAGFGTRAGMRAALGERTLAERSLAAVGRKHASKDDPFFAITAVICSGCTTRPNGTSIILYMFLWMNRFIFESEKKFKVFFGLNILRCWIHCGSCVFSKPYFCGNRIWTYDLKIMSLASYQTALSRMNFHLLIPIV